jgi:hypothetical protein
MALEGKVDIQDLVLVRLVPQTREAVVVEAAQQTQVGMAVQVYLF